MTPTFKLRNALVAAAVTACGTAFAAPTTFFGEDLAVGGVRPATTANSDAARNQFLANLTGVGTETFETRSGSAPLAIAFPGAGTATMTGTGSVQTSPGAGRYAISGTNFWEANTGSFTVTFSGPIAAFGFYATDVGDYGATLGLELTRSGGGTVLVTVPLTLGVGGNTSDSALFFGFVDASETYSQIRFVNSGSTSGDIFGFDDMTVGSREQITTVPTPGTLALVGAALLGFGAASARRSARRG